MLNPAVTPHQPPNTARLPAYLPACLPCCPLASLPPCLPAPRPARLAPLPCLAGHSHDIMVRDFDIRCSMQHDMGTDSSSKFGVFMDGRMVNGNLDLHRWVDGWVRGSQPGSGC